MKHFDIIIREEDGTEHDLIKCITTDDVELGLVQDTLEIRLAEYASAVFQYPALPAFAWCNSKPGLCRAPVNSVRVIGD